MPEYVADRAYARVYNTPTRTELHRFLTEAVDRSRARLLYASDPKRSPVYLGIQTPADERVGVLVYPFTANHRLIKNRPADEHRMQIRYGGEASWKDDHPLGRDIAGIDTTLVVGIHLEAGLLIGLDPSLYDPLPMGISIEFKEANVAAADTSGWHVFERDNITGRKRANPRAASGLETVVMFKPDRLLDYVRLERTAADFALDPALRFVAANEAATPRADSDHTFTSTHDLETQFEMTSSEILTMISKANRLSTAVKGGVAEFHLGKQLTSDTTSIAKVVPLDKDGLHDFDVTMATGEHVRVECKNASPKKYANGDIKVEVQKTRATQNDPAGRLYRIDQFDVVAACLKGPTGSWRFRYRRTSLLTEDQRHPGRIAPLQRVTDDWATTLKGAL
ncbi:hypothetical protein [Amycolatopsis sp. NPDC049159]|uniref:hypothetical protein n=1 Tax=Amycolatopsis sp. NPDC049159 TaxID=3157210 RepID=UPI0033E2D616